jgi:hypothetical protein
MERQFITKSKVCQIIILCFCVMVASPFLQIEGEQQRFGALLFLLILFPAF